MGSLNPESGPKQELNDSGYVQDDAPSKEATAPAYKGTTNLLDLSDDVLLYILRYCSPRDLKALGYVCPRLGTVTADRTLWVHVDARSCPTGALRMRWLLTHTLSAHTTSLLLSGYAREATGCLGFMRGSRDKDAAEEEKSLMEVSARSHNMPVVPRMLTVAAQSLRRYGGGFPFWPDHAPSSRPVAASSNSDIKCPGPQVTLTAHALTQLSSLCTNLTELVLDYCVIDCAKTNISMFPTSLKKLSLNGTKCYNLEKSFLFKIQDRLVHLEELDLSRCDWIEPACMLPLSKVEKLRTLVMQECPKLTEFVAYASLATRYGFKALKVLDLRGSPVGDSEVSALGWVPNLEELYLSPARSTRKPPEHAHYTHDPWPTFRELEPWEEQEPEYYKSQYASQQWLQDEANALDNGEGKCVPLDDSAMASCILLERLFAEPVLPDQYNELYHRFNPDNHRINLATPDDYRTAYGLYMNRPRREQSQNMAHIINGMRGGNESKRKNDDEAGPSKRQKTKASKKQYEDSEIDSDCEQCREEQENERKRKLEEEKNKKIDKVEKMDESSDDDDDDDSRPNVIPIPVNQGASTSKVIVIEGKPSTSRCDFKIEKDGTIKFSQNQPLYVELPSNNNNSDEPNLNRDGHNLNVKISREVATDGCVNIKLTLNPRDIANQACSSNQPSSSIQASSSNQPSSSIEASESMQSNQDSNLNNESNVKEADLNEAGPSGQDKPDFNNASKDNKDLNKASGQDNEPDSKAAATDNNKSDLNPASSGNNSQDLNQQDLNEASSGPDNKQDLNEAGPSGHDNKDSNEANPNQENKSTNTDANQRRVVYVNVRQGGALRINNFMPPDFIYDPDISHRLEYTSLVTDSAIRRFGRADGENINYVQIGPNGPIPAPVDDPHARPDRSNLRVLSVTGYRNITNVSLTHLATAAPRLELLDFTGTRVTNMGVEHFRNFRPNCEVRFGQYEDTEPE